MNLNKFSLYCESTCKSLYEKIFKRPSPPSSQECIKNNVRVIQFNANIFIHNNVFDICIYIYLSSVVQPP